LGSTTKRSGDSMTENDETGPWLDKHLGEHEVNMGSAGTLRVNVGANDIVIIDKLYGPLCASDVRIYLEYKDDKDPEWVVEYLNPAKSRPGEDVWEEKARWDCQESWPKDET